MISIVIPVYNEEENLPGLFEHLKEVNTGYISEIIVVDGGSEDNTAIVTKAFPEIKYSLSKKGRAVQMNVGASMATSEILYFLHADSLPPAGFDKLILEEIKKGNNAGCFQLKFDKDHWWLKLMGYFTRFNHISCRGGDQSLFIKSQLFKEIGGFNESYKIYEDNEIVKRLYAKKQFVVIMNQIITSARLYENMGIWNTQLLFAEIYWKRRLGASPEELYSHYYKRLNS